ncbi:MAG: cytochrome c oxidase subunit 3 [Deltaproteobacteria bacterium]|nr:cytochrome c oxidase subunit 3 [Deltaproteobacteria bacterium]
MNSEGGEIGILAPQFDTLKQQNEASVLGMWIFLVTEIMFFGALFSGYAVYRFMYPVTFIESSHLLNVGFGSVNTGILLTSSLTMVLAVYFAQRGRNREVCLLLLLTALLGLVFLEIKAFEWVHDFKEGLVPGKYFSFPGANAKQVQLFFCLYFIMTGVHGLHVLIGVCLMLWLAFLVYRRKCSGNNYMKVELSGLYWHFVDVIWIFLFPLFYLIGGSV